MLVDRRILCSDRGLYGVIGSTGRQVGLEEIYRANGEWGKNRHCLMVMMVHYPWFVSAESTQIDQDIRLR